MRIVIVGASVAGLSTAEALRHEGFTGEIVLLGDEAHAPYARPPLSKQILDGSWASDRLALRSPAELDALDLDHRFCRATSLDLSARELRTTAGILGYDVLVLATGAEPTRPAGVPGIDHALVLRTLDDGFALREALSRPGREIVVLGAGVLASEIASAARLAGDRVTLVGRSGTLSVGTIGTLLTERLAALHEANGVHLELTVGVRAVEGSAPAPGRAARAGTPPYRVTLGDGRDLPADVVIAATGSRPRTDWLQDSGLEIEDGVLCDADGRAAPGVYAVGDVARWTDRASGESPRIEHQTSAIDQAHSVARTLQGGPSPAPPVPFFWSEIHGTRLQAYGTFPSDVPLTVLEEAGGRALLASIDPHSGSTRGVVGWKAARAFRDARALVDRDRRLAGASTRSGTGVGNGAAAIPGVRDALSLP